MNPYDILHYDVRQYEYDELAIAYVKKARKRGMAARILIIILGIIAIAGIIKVNATGAVFLTFLMAYLTVFMWLSFCGAHASNRLYRASLRAYRDYIYYFYRRTKKLSNKQKYLLLLGKCNIRLGEYENCLYALDLLQEDQMSLYYKGSYYMQRVIAKRLLGDTKGYEQEYHSYYAVTNENSPEVERRRRILTGENPEECISLIDITEPLKQNKKRANFLFGWMWFLFLAVLFTQGEHMLPTGYEYRSWLDITGKISLILFGLIFTSATLVKLYQFINERFAHAMMRVVSNVALAVLIVAEVGLYLVLLFSTAVNYKPEKVSGNTIRVLEPGVYTKDRYYICEPRGLFFREILFYEDDEFGNSGGSTSSNDGSSYYDDYYSDYYNDYFSDYYDYYDDFYWEDMLDDSSTEKDYQAIYDFDFKDTEGALELNYSAKGNLYATMSEYELEDGTVSGAVTARKRLVYDRESKNALYDLVVCYVDYFDADGKQLDSTSIYDFYAVEKDTYKVIRADKHAWEDLGSKEYREATGE